MPSTQKSFFAPISLLFTTIFSVAGPFVMFYPVFLLGRGLAAEEVGYAMSGMALGKLVSVAIMAFLIDKSQKPHWYLVGAALVAALMMLINGFSDVGAWFLIMMTFMFSAFWSMTVPLAEGFSLRACRLQNDLNYGRMRLFGSASFFLGGMVVGELMGWFDAWGYSGIDIFVIAIAFGASMVAFVASSLPNFYKLEQEAGIITDEAVDAQNLMKMIKTNIPLMIMIAGASIMHAGHAALFQYAASDWLSKGYSSTMVSLFFGVGIVAEVILFWYAAVLKRNLRTIHFFLIAGFGSMIRWAGMATDPSFEMIILLQTLHALTFGALHLGVIRYIRKNLQGHYHGAAQLIYGGAMWGLAMIPASAVTGHLYAVYGVHSYYFMSLFALVGTAITMIPLFPREKWFKRIFMKKEQLI